MAIGGVITTGSIPSALWEGINQFWGENYSEHGMEYMDLFDMQSSGKNYEEDSEITGFGMAPRKAEGDAISYDSQKEIVKTTYKHLTYGLGYKITFEEIEDNLYAELATRRTKALMFSLKQTKETVGANIYNRGFNTSYPIGDGAALLSAAHPTLNGNQSNILATAAVLSQASVEDLTIQIQKAENNRGLKIAIAPRSLIVSPDNVWEAEKILKSQFEPATDNNAINPITNVFADGAKVNHYLTSATAWFIRTDVPEGMKMFDRMPATLDRDNEFDTKNLAVSAVTRCSFGASDFRGIYGTPGA